MGEVPMMCVRARAATIWMMAVVLHRCQGHCDSSVVRLKSYPGTESGVQGTLRMRAVPGTHDLIHVTGFVTGLAPSLLDGL